MQQINNILVALSFDTKEQAEINHALTLAKLYNSNITLLSVIPSLSSKEQEQISAMSPEERINKLILQRKEALSITEQSIKDDGYTASSHVTTGKPSEEIIKLASNGHHDLVIIGTRPQKNITETLFGSTSNAVLRKCPTPVLAIKPDHPEKYERIMASVDISQNPKIINNKVLSEAGFLAEADNSELHLLTVIPQKVQNSDSTTDAKVQLDALVTAAKLDDNNVKTHVSTGNVVSVIPEHIEKHNIDLLVMGMASRTGIKGFFLGNLAEKIMSSINCSILAVKPDEFKG